jgi:CP family cyanate transporter-like MFS transporter
MGLLWVAGIDLRLTVLCLAPVIPLIHRDLKLSESQVGLLTGMTPLLLAAAAIPGSLLIARVGARRAVIAGLVLTGMASALRGVGPAVAVLFAMSFLMSTGIAVLQPAYPALVRAWLPAQVGLATAVYANGLLVGEVIPAGLTVPLVLPLVHQSWELSFVVWSLPVLATAAVIALATPHRARTSAALVRWWPDWRDSRTWSLGFIFGIASALYWTANAFIPDYLHATGRPALVAPALTTLNLFQIPASILIGVFAGRIVGRRWPFVVASLLSGLALIAFVAMPGAWAVVWAGSFGFLSGGILVLTLALPPLMVEADDVPRLAAAMFTISYTCSFLAPAVGGAAWDLTGNPASAFVIVGAASFAVAFLALRLRMPRPQASAAFSGS